ncbi:hypothetical protein IWQ60_006222 [Tieghemiomyces parasiticus]|uniref:Uncharacterized protein n=1 Tax=Tieghemiomyces parasiticus TaxID=78921 RepID=A0A9W8DY65_9FUNG|nr:hypothetical protein IWQ60_006222 [Tieghemiomyces parasiticus]
MVPAVHHAYTAAPMEDTHTTLSPRGSLLKRAKSVVSRQAKTTQLSMLRRTGTLRTRAELNQNAVDWVNAQEAYLFQQSFWSAREGLKKARQLEQREKDAQLRGNVLIRLVKLHGHAGFTCVVVSVPDRFLVRGDMAPYKYANESRTETILELKTYDPFHMDIVRVLAQRYSLK